MLRRILAAAGLCLMFAAAPALAQSGTPATPAELLAEAEARLAADPQDQKALVAAARASIMLRDGPRAIRYLEQLREGSDNLDIRRALLLQYSAAADWEKHAGIMDDVMRLTEAGAIPAQALREEVFAVDTFRHGVHAVSAFRHFEPSGPHRHIYTGVVNRADAPGKAPLLVTFGSTVVTDDFDREQNPDRKYERLYSYDTHLTPAEGSYKHETLRFATAVPAYPDFRQAVIDYLDGKLQPQSSSTVPMKQK